MRKDYTYHNGYFDHNSRKPDRSNRYILIALCLVAIACSWIYIISSQLMYIEQQNDGCIASAYQASKNGFDLEANLAVCN
jgi:hypothetical protein